MIRDGLDIPWISDIVVVHHHINSLLKVAFVFIKRNFCKNVNVMPCCMFEMLDFAALILILLRCAPKTGEWGRI